MKRIVVYHIFFWGFVFWMTLDAMLVDYELGEAILFSLLECSINALIAYSNLFFLIPKVLIQACSTPKRATFLKKGWILSSPTNPVRKTQKA